MLIDLTGTDAAKVNAALVAARRRSGSPAMGMVLTLVIVTDEGQNYDALRAATDAAREHPSRILVVVGRPGRGEPRLDAEVRVGGENGPGEVVLLRLHGPLASHAESVALPLLLPDAPVVTWWPGASPDSPCEDALGGLAQRRVTDAAASAQPLVELAKRAAGYRPGDTDLSWTRLTTWRTLLASTLDEAYGEVNGAEVSAEESSPSAELLALWLGDRLQVDVRRFSTEGPGITAVRLTTPDGDISVTRPDGRMAVLSRPGWPDRPVALHRRSTAELIAEELRRLDPDDVYGDTIRLVQSRRSVAPSAAEAAEDTAAAQDQPPVTGSRDDESSSRSAAEQAAGRAEPSGHEASGSEASGSGAPTRGSA